MHQRTKIEKFIMSYFFIKHMKKGGMFILFLILVFSFVNLISATEISFHVIRNQPVNIIESCIVGGFPCGTDFSCNITVVNPIEQIIVLNKEMTRNETIYNYTISHTLINISGIYCYNTFCSNNNLNGSIIKCFQASDRGESLDTPKAILYIVVLITSILIFISCLYAAAAIEGKNLKGGAGEIISINHLKYLKLLLFVFSYLIMIWIVNILVGITSNFLSLGIAFNFFRVIFFFMISSLFFLMPFAFIILIVNIINDIQASKLIRRGINRI